MDSRRWCASGPRASWLPAPWPPTAGGGHVDARPTAPRGSAGGSPVVPARGPRVPGVRPVVPSRPQPLFSLPPPAGGAPHTSRPIRRDLRLRAQAKVPIPFPLAQGTDCATEKYSEKDPFPGFGRSMRSWVHPRMASFATPAGHCAVALARPVVRVRRWAVSSQRTVAYSIHRGGPPGPAPVHAPAGSPRSPIPAVGGLRSTRPHPARAAGRRDRWEPPRCNGGHAVGPLRCRRHEPQGGLPCDGCYWAALVTPRANARPS